MNTYMLIMGAAGIIILSFFFNILAKKTNIPSVLMLIALGMGLNFGLGHYGIIDEDLQLHSILSFTGNVGLVMIVLEAALDLKLERKKIRFIIEAFLTAVIGFAGSMFALGSFFYYIFDTDFFTAVLYAVPLSIMSSAIVIPSVGGLRGSKKEFMVYESTFADILGIMVFYFMIGADGSSGGGFLAGEIILNILLTTLLAVVVAYVMVYLFQHLQMQVKLFLIVAVLMFLYAFGKYFHLSSLLIILAFGVVLSNTDVFFRGRLAKHFDKTKVAPILHDFHILTLESSFLVRTFFFVIFGLSISVASLLNWEVAVNSFAIVGILFVVRLVTLKLIVKKNIFPQLFIAPRGLITVLLFFVLLEGKSTIENFDTGLLLYPILISSLIMMIALIINGGDKVKDVMFHVVPLVNNDPEVRDEIEKRIQENSENPDFDALRH